MKIKLKKFVVVILMSVLSSISIGQTKPESVNLKNEYAKTVLVLMDAIQKRQIIDKKSSEYGAIQCEHCNVLHTRASESVYPLMVAFQLSGKKKYLQAAINTGNWLISKQEKNGSWKETPEEWTGTTTDQLLMLLEAWPLIKNYLSKEEQKEWNRSIVNAADYLTAVMNHQFASINYCATTSATLARMNSIFPDKRYVDKSRSLAHMIASKMNDDGFIDGEGGSENGTKLGSDLGYEMEMTLWGLAYYARLSSDRFIDSLVRKSVKNHLSFILPDGIMDDSWGTRSNKWTTFGSATSDGVQILFTLVSDDDSRYAAASYFNLLNIRKNITNDLIGYGPHHSRVMKDPPCIYTTFTKAKNLAMSYMFEKDGFRKLEKLPSEQQPWIKFLPMMNVIQLRTKMFISTITAYNYADLKRDRSKYMQRPTGGTTSIVWCEDMGVLQASSQTKYLRGEPMSFPVVDSIICLTPRIEYNNKRGYFTNLYEYNAKISSNEISKGSFAVNTSGELRDNKFLAGGVAYSIDYLFTDSAYQKTIDLRYHDDFDTIRIVEPFVQNDDMKIISIDSKTTEISYSSLTFQFKLTKGDASLHIGEGEQYYWSPYPAIKAYPITLKVPPPINGFRNKVVYTIKLIK